MTMSPGGAPGLGSLGGIDGGEAGGGGLGGETVVTNGLVPTATNSSYLLRHPSFADLAQHVDHISD